MVWIIVAIVIIVLGVVELGVSMITIDKNKEKLNEFVQHLFSMLEKLDSNNDCQNEFIYMLANCSKISKIANEDVYNHPIVELKSAIKYGKLYEIKSLVPKIYSDFLKVESELNDLRELNRKDLYNPFTLFYRGVELTTKYVFGYIILKFNSDFDFRGKSWILINVIISLVSGILTIWQFII